MLTKRGTKAADDLSAGPIFPGENYPPPPKALSVLEAKVWEETVGAMKPGWFNLASAPLLEAYCVLVGQLRDVAERIRLRQDVPADRVIYLKLVTDVGTLATRLRLTPQSNRAGVYDGRKAPSTRVKPWERDDDTGRQVQPWEL
jgi:hypothetical protein